MTQPWNRDEWLRTMRPSAQTRLRRTHRTFVAALYASTSQSQLPYLARLLEVSVTSLRQAQAVLPHPECVREVLEGRLSLTHAARAVAVRQSRRRHHDNRSAGGAADVVDELIEELRAYAVTAYVRFQTEDGDELGNVIRIYRQGGDVVILLDPTTSHDPVQTWNGLLRRSLKSARSTGSTANSSMGNEQETTGNETHERRGRRQRDRAVEEERRRTQV